MFGECPDNWVANDDSCYYVSDLHGGLHGGEYTWQEAETKCEYYGGTLVIIGDSTENVCFVLSKILLIHRHSDNIFYTILLNSCCLDNIHIVLGYLLLNYDYGWR